RSQALGENVSGHVVQHHGHEYVALAWGELMCDGLAQSAHEVQALKPRINLPSTLSQPIPSWIVIGDGYRPLPPGVPTQLHRDLEYDKLVGPRGEAARTAVVVELARHRHQGVVGSLLADVVELHSTQRDEMPSLL